MSDAQGVVRFMTGLGEMAKGASRPSTMPVWQRDILFARDPPRVTCTHPEYTEVEDTKGTILPPDDMAHKSFLFGPSEISALRRFVPSYLKKCSTFEVIVACVWRCRTIALQPDPEEEMHMICIVSVRGRFNPPLPKGYYGNGFAYSIAISTAGDLTNKPLGHALKLVMKAKSDVTEEYIRSAADLMVIKGRPPITVVNSYLVSDLTHAGFDVVDFEWGKPAHGGTAIGAFGVATAFGSVYISFTNHKGESGIGLPICLPSAAMYKFVEELNKMLAEDNSEQVLREHKF